MSNLLIHGSYLLVGLTAGGLIGGLLVFWLQSNRRRNTLPADEAHASWEDAMQSLQAREQRTDSLLHKLGELAENIVFDVEEHSQTMHHVSDELKQQNVQAPDAAPALITAVARILEANESLRTRLNSAESKLNEQSQVIATHVKESRTDALTQVANRRAFDIELAEARNELQDGQQPICVMMVDVDRFKNLNDSYGHQAGDEVLKQVARTLRRTTKSDGHVFRYGGEEFAIILRDRTAPRALQFAERIRAAVGARALDHDGLVLEVTASAGLAELAEQETCDDVVRRADAALYEAKRNGRNCAFWNDGKANLRIPTIPSADCLADDEEVEEEAIAVEPRSRTRSDWRTQISNHDEFIQDVKRRIAGRKRNGGVDSMVLLRVDDFGEIEHARGPETAEILLRATSQFLKASVREMDHVALYSENAFALWLPTASLDNAARIGERLRSAVARCKVPARGGALTFTVSTGITELTDGDTPQTICERCEKAMNQASQRGGNRCVAAREGQFASIGADAEIQF